MLVWLPGCTSEIQSDGRARNDRRCSPGRENEASLQRAKHDRLSPQHSPDTPAHSRGAHSHRDGSQVKPVQNWMKLLEELKN